MLDRFIIEFDTGLRTLFAEAHTGRPYPDNAIKETLSEKKDKSRSISLMRVNHSGEVCAQALYSGQSLTADNPETAEALKEAAKEETEHLAWCEKRIKELGGRTSLLNPILYAGSFSLGAIAGALGDKWNLGFLAETEHQVEKHLEKHLSLLPEHDDKSRAIVTQMQHDEAAHAETAIEHGGAELPRPIKSAMQLFSKLMTTTTYHL
ncbi:MAG: 2-polyprenyl-3-methyl-6-methoxy-1,4-benzoquinone monooxygenase [Methylophilaceae bacterium]|uniref:2-polyprenyl-3-methyl-6-methoxy-1,4-benzoquinone monooxygenase n=1 Tax=Methylovorus sp. MM2 TaxID=1848038 RepID=UPI0007E0A525|nr:2-polyprenyl-3-methyl-6-methoxy-1,4-benzoquinone monooxygenase [Methylovorus sp. MM2]OAM51627.1 2-octaprenyl-3-methyl-6-methoxy-1,4-benzoquinol hydroxylase [Methylovorus sp. MM2]